MKSTILRQIANILYAISRAAEKIADRLVWLSRRPEER